MTHGSSRKHPAGRRRIARFLGDASGQDLGEYAILVAGIALIVVTAIGLTGEALRDFWQSIVDSFPL